MPLDGFSLFVRWTRGGLRRSASSLFLVVCTLSACAPEPVQRSSTPARSSDVVTIGVPEGDSSTGDVGFQQLWRVFSFEGLTSRGTDGRPIPGIATAWSVSSDGLSWTFTLRPNTYFHDGSRCDANAVKLAIEVSLSQPQITSLYPGLLDIKTVRAEGDGTVVIELMRPSAFLLDDLSVLITRRLPDGKTVSTGPYAPSSILPTEVVLRSHSLYPAGAPTIKTIVVRSFPTLRQAWASLLRNEIDVVSNVPADAQEFLTSGQVELFKFQRHYAYVMTLNLRRPELASSATRRALNAALDRSAIIKTVLKGYGRPAFGPVWPEHWAYDGGAPHFPFDPSSARARLGGDGVQLARLPPSTRLRFTCLVPSGHAVFERMALVLQRQLYDVGVDLSLEAIALTEINERLRSGDFDAVLMDLVSAPTLSRVYQFWHSPRDFQGLNVFGYDNSDADRWLDRLRFATDEAATRAATGQLQRALMQDPPALFIAWSERARAVSRRIRIPKGKDLDPFQLAAEWQLVTSDSVAQ